MKALGIYVLAKQRFDPDRVVEDKATLLKLMALECDEPLPAEPQCF
jgi:hypothetical protein